MPAESKAPLGPRGYHGSREEEDDLKKQKERINPLAGFFGDAVQYVNALFGDKPSVKKVPPPLPKNPPRSRPLPPPRPPKGPPSAPPPAITDEMKAVYAEYAKAEEAYHELKQEIAGLKDTSEFTSSKQLKHALNFQVVTEKDYLSWLAELDEKRKKISDLQSFIADARRTCQKIADLRDNLDRAKIQLRNAYRNDETKLEADVERPLVFANALHAALHEIKKLEVKGSYNERKRAICELKDAKQYQILPLDFEQIYTRFQEKYGVKPKESAKLEATYKMKCSALRMRTSEVTDYEASEPYLNILKIQALKKLLIFLKDNLFSDENIKHFWPRHTLRFLCWGGFDVDGAHVPTGVGKIKLLLKNLNLETLSDAATVRCWDSVLKEVNERPLEVVARYTPTETCYAALRALSGVRNLQVPMIEAHVNQFIADMQNMSELRTYQAEKLTI